MTLPQLLTVELNKLFIDPANVRTNRETDDVSELAANIRANISQGGIHQPLVVRKQGNKFGVIAGGRRLTALVQLKQEKHINGTYPVAVKLFEGSDAEAVEVSAAENTIRADMTLSEEYLAFRDMYAGGKGLSEKDIADRYNTSLKRVKSLISLGSLPESAVKGLDDRSIDLSTLQLLANCPYPDRVTSALERIDDFTYSNPLEDYLCPNEVDAGHYMVKFVGLAAYKKAGGTLRDDLFATDDEKIIEDYTLVETLAQKKLERIREKVAKEGWQSIEVCYFNDSPDTWKYEEITHCIGEMPADIKKEHGILFSEHAKLVDTLDSMDYTDWDARREVEKAIQQHKTDIKKLEKPFYYYSDQQKLDFTYFIYLTQYNGLKTFIGRKKTTTKAAVPAAEKPDYTKKCLEKLINYKSIAAKTAIADNPRVAKALLVYPFLLRNVRDTTTPDFIQVGNNNHLSEYAVQDIEAGTAFHERYQAILTDNNIGPDGDIKPHEGELLDWLIALSDTELDSLIAVVVADQINFNSGYNGDPAQAKFTNRVCHAAEVNVHSVYQVDEDTLKSMKVDAIEEAVKESGTEQDLKLVTQAKTKKAKVGVALPILKGAAWLPKPLRIDD